MSDKTGYAAQKDYPQYPLIDRVFMDAHGYTSIKISRKVKLFERIKKLRADNARLTAELAELRTVLKSKEIIIDNQEKRINELADRLLKKMNNKKSEWRSNFVKAIEEGSTEPDFDAMPIGEINQYLREHGYDPEKVGLRGKILAEALTKNIIAREIIQRFLNNEGGCRFCEYDKYLPLDAPKNGHEENCLYLAARAYLDNDTSVVVKRDLSDAEIEELGAHEAESRGDK